MHIHTEAVSLNLLKLLQELMAVDYLRQFYLVGGTALALHYGHRKSIDLDLFSHVAFDAAELREHLSVEFNLSETSSRNNTVLGQIRQIKTDFIAHQYPLIEPVVEIDSLRLASPKDIAAMKLNAIANRGSKKDFWDYAELLTHFSHKELLGAYASKYPQASQWTAEKSLSYFDDAENDPDPMDLSGRTWAEVKTTILQQLKTS